MMRCMVMQSGAVLTCDSLHGSIQVVECLTFHDYSSNLRGYSALRPAFLDTNTSAGLLDGIYNCLAIERAESADMGNQK